MTIKQRPCHVIVLVEIIRVRAFRMEAQRSRLHQLPHHNGTSDHNQAPLAAPPSHARCLTLVVSNGIRHNREPGLHTSTIASTATITPIRNGFNANGTHIRTHRIKRNQRTPSARQIRTHTEPPAAAACTYSEHGEDTDTELTVPALRLTSGRTRTVRNTCSDCLAALSNAFEDTGSIRTYSDASPHRPAYMPASDR